MEREIERLLRHHLLCKLPSLNIGAPPPPRIKQRQRGSGPKRQEALRYQEAPVAPADAVRPVAPGVHILEPRGELSGARHHVEEQHGALHGLESFSQLFTPTAAGCVMPASAISIDDAPRFRHRGLLIDTGRHWLPLSAIEAAVDAAAEQAIEKIDSGSEL